MTREEAIEALTSKNVNNSDMMLEALEMAIEALEQDTVPFDFKLYQAGLMDMPKGIIDVLYKIETDINEEIDDLHILNDFSNPKDEGIEIGLKKALAFIDKHKPKMVK